MKSALLYLWQLPQNILGFLMSRLWRKRLSILDDRVIANVVETEKKFGIKIYVADYESHKNDKLLGLLSGHSLGKYVCIDSWANGATVLHENGHCEQSKKLGPLYLPVVGLSSAFCNIWDRVFHTGWSYYSRCCWYFLHCWQEKWADKLGGVNRADVLFDILPR